jgi:hypothetical protein
MKNFLEATVTKAELRLELELALSEPAEITLNQHTTLGKELHEFLPLTDPILLKIVGQDHIALTKLSIDGHDIPNYHWHQTAGVWTLEIPSFYPWLHDITGQGWIA